jgi:hypothetical protein
MKFKMKKLTTLNELPPRATSDHNSQLTNTFPSDVFHHTNHVMPTAISASQHECPLSDVAEKFTKRFLKKRNNLERSHE